MKKTTPSIATTSLILLLSVFVLHSPVARAQHFEWAKGYGSAANDGNSIVGTVADSQGNLYILGDFHPDAEWDGVPLLPMTPYGSYHDTRSVVVAKISPSGEMLWRKVIHANNNSVSRGYDIRMLGDTAIAFMARCNPPTRLNYLYYLDTLYADDEDFFFDMTYLRWYAFSVFVVLDLEGNTLENHVMYTTYVDRDGNDIMYEQTNAYGTWNVYDNNEIFEPSFDIDPEGNIYLCRWANDYISGYAGLPGYDLENGDLSAVKFWVDNRVVGVVDIPKGARYWFPQLIKFSPHLDTVLASRYLVQKGRSEISHYGNLVKCRQNGDVYVIWNIQPRDIFDTIICDSLEGKKFVIIGQNAGIGYLCAYDSLFNQKWGLSIDNVSVLDSNIYTFITWENVCFDEDSNLIFLSSDTFVNSANGDTSHFAAILSYDGNIFPIQKSSSIVMTLREQANETPELIKCVRFPSIFSAVYGHMACSNNRIFMQAKAQGGFVFPLEAIEFERSYGEWSIGLAVLDYQMHLIVGYDFDSRSPKSKSGPITITDSILYITNYISDAHARFGEMLFQEDLSKHYAVIAKYVDTSFMRPYIAPVTTGIPDMHSINMATPYPNPTTDRVQIDLTDEVLLTASTLSMLGQRTTLGHNGTSVDVSPLAPGIYIMEIHTSKNDYKCKFIKY